VSTISNVIAGRHTALRPETAMFIFSALDTELRLPPTDRTLFSHHTGVNEHLLPTSNDEPMKDHDDQVPVYIVQYVRDLIAKHGVNNTERVLVAVASLLMYSRENKPSSLSLPKEALNYPPGLRALVKPPVERDGYTVQEFVPIPGKPDSHERAKTGPAPKRRARGA
jgi:hypothetical protein